MVDYENVRAVVAEAMETLEELLYKINIADNADDNADEEV